MHKSIPKQTKTKQRAKSSKSHHKKPLSTTATTPTLITTLSSQAKSYSSSTTQNNRRSNNSYNSGNNNQSRSRQFGNRGGYNREGNQQERPVDPLNQNRFTPAQTAIPFDKVPVKFTDLGVAPEIADVLHTQGIVAPSTIQKQAIPTILEGGDVCITAQTGQGKTLAYTLPLIQKLVEDESLGKVSQPSAPRALILVPTRELALQVEKTTKALSHAHNFRLRSRAITGDQSPSYMRQILRGENSNDSIVLLNSTEAKVRDQIRLAATVASRIVNQLFKENNWTYNRASHSSAKKMNKKIQEQRREAAEDGKAFAMKKLEELENELKIEVEGFEAQGSSDQTNNTPPEPTKTTKTSTKSTKTPHPFDVPDDLEEGSDEIPDALPPKTLQEDKITMLNKQIAQKRSQIAKFNNELELLDQVAATSAAVANGTVPVTRNWSQIKRSIKRETTRFAYALFALSQDATVATESLNALGGKSSKNASTTNAEAPNRIPFTIPGGDLEDGLDVKKLFFAEPLAVRTVANEFVTALATDHLHDKSRTINSIHLPVPLMKQHYLSDERQLGEDIVYKKKDMMPTTTDSQFTTKPSKSIFKPIQVLVPTRQEIIEQQMRSRRRGGKTIMGGDDDEGDILMDFDEKMANFDGFDGEDMPFSENEDDLAMKEAFHSTDGFTAPSVLEMKRKRGMMMNFDEIVGQNDPNFSLILRSDLLKKKDQKIKNLPQGNDNNGTLVNDNDNESLSNDDEVESDANHSEDSTYGNRVDGDYFILNRNKTSPEDAEYMIDVEEAMSHEQSASSQGTYTPSAQELEQYQHQREDQVDNIDTTATTTTTTTTKTLANGKNTKKAIPLFMKNDLTGFKHKKKHFSMLDHASSSRSFFIDVDYITKIALQSLEALAPGIVEYQSLGNSTPQLGDNEVENGIAKEPLQKHLLTYASIAQQVQDYVINLPLSDLYDLSLSVGNDGEEDAFLHNEAKTNDPQEYQNAESLYHKDKLQRNLDILICTPSRLIQLIQWRAIKLGKVNYAVLDEADLLLTSRTHIPQNVKTAFQQLTQDQKQNLAKHVSADSKSPINQVIQDLQIRNGELYQAMIPLLTRMKGEYELNHGHLPQVKTPNTVFRLGHQSDHSRTQSEFFKGLILAKKKKIQKFVEKLHPNLDPQSDQFNAILRDHYAESIVDDNGVPLSLTNLDSTSRDAILNKAKKIKQSATPQDKDGDDDNNDDVSQEEREQLPIHNLKSLKTRIAEHEDDMKVLDELDEEKGSLNDKEDQTSIEKYLKLSKTIEPIQFIYTSATLSSTNTQFHSEITKINPLYTEQFNPRGLKHTTTSDALCLPTCLKQTFVQVGNRDKLHILTEVLSSPDLLSTNHYFPTQTMVFCNTIASARAVGHALAEKGISVSSVHSGVPPRHRADNWEKFFNNQTGVMVATDIASRGVHHPSIRYIINFDFPLSPVDYLHRAGRATTLPGQVGSMRHRTNKGVNSSRAITQDTKFITLGQEEEQGQNLSQMDRAYDELDKTDATSSQQTGLQSVVLDADGKPVQKRGEVISLINKADQVLAYAINEATKRLSPITSLSADKKDYHVQQGEGKRDEHDGARTQSRDEERILSATSKGFQEAKDKLVRSLQGTDVFIGGKKVSNPQLINSALRKAAKEHILHRDRFSNVSDQKRRVDLTSDKRRAEERYVRQQTEYAATMGFDKPLLSKTAKINAEYPDRVLSKKVDQSLQGLRERAYRVEKQKEKMGQFDRDHQRTYKELDQLNTKDQYQKPSSTVSRRTPSFSHGEDSHPHGLGNQPGYETAAPHNKRSGNYRQGNYNNNNNRGRR